VTSAPVCFFAVGALALARVAWMSGRMAAISGTAVTLYARGKKTRMSLRSSGLLAAGWPLGDISRRSNSLFTRMDQAGSNYCLSWDGRGR
jgi:hypothetical protein